MTLKAVRVAFPRGRQFVFETDIQNFFGEIDRQRLLGPVAESVSDRQAVKRLRRPAS